MKIIKISLPVVSLEGALDDMSAGGVGLWEEDDEPSSSPESNFLNCVFAFICYQHY